MKNPSVNTSKPLSTSYLKIGQAAKALGVSIDTLRRWEKAGKIKAVRTPGGTRLYHISILKKVNPSIETYQIGSLSTEELLKRANEQNLPTSVIARSEATWQSTAEDPSLTAQDDKLTGFKKSLLTKFLIGFAVLSVITIFLASWITASYLTQPKATQQFFKNNVASGLFLPFHKLAEEAVAIIDRRKAKELGFIPSEESPPIPNSQLSNLNSNVLAVTTSPQFLEINSDTQINGSLFVRDSINGLSVEATPSASTFALTTGDTTLTVTKDALLDQDVSTTASPTFNTLNLSATKNQLVFQSGGPTGTLTWTPTATRVITLPDVTTTLVGIDNTQTLTNKSMSGSSNTFTNIPNSALSNNKVTVTAGTNLTGGGDITLGSSATISLKDSISLSGTLTAGGVVKLADGTAAAPGLTFTNDTDTGLYRIGANSIGLITGGSATSGITIDSSGNLGIGTISPGAALEVNGQVKITGGSPGTNKVLTSDSNGLATWSSVAGVGGITGSGTSGYIPVFDSSSSITNSSTIWNSGGNVGISTSAPSQIFQVNTNTSNPFVVTSGGNVGIGFTSPDRLLQIGSDINIVGTAASILGANGAQFSITGSTANTLHKKLTLGLDTTDNYGIIQAGNTSGTAYGLVLNPAGGNVGIGTTNLNARIAGTSAPILRVVKSDGVGGGTIEVQNTTSGGGDSTVDFIDENGNVRGNIAYYARRSANDPARFVINQGWPGEITPLNTVLNENGGNVGIGITGPGAKLAVSGNATIGWGAGTIAGPSNGLAVSGNVGIGTTTANSNLSVVGGAHIGGLFQGIAAPANGLFVDGNVGIGATTSSNKLDVWGNARIAGTLTVDSTSTFGGNLTLSAGQFLAPNGSTSLPSYSFTNSTSTGMYSPSSNALALNTNGASTPPLTITAGGNVGIGTTSPNNALELFSGTPPQLRIAHTASSYLTIGVSSIGGTTFDAVGSGAGFTFSDAVSLSANNAALSFTGTTPSITAGGSVLGIFAGGNVGIGTTATLGASLVVNGNTNIGSGYITSSGISNGLAVQGNLGVGTTTANSNLSVAGGAHIGGLFQGIAAPANGLFVDGNVGIGATTSSNKLDVWGNARIAGTLIVDSTSTFGGNLTLSNGQFLAPNGTATLPSYSFSSLTNAGLWTNGDGLLLTTGGASTSGLTVTGAGRVGIGTTAPNRTLEVYSGDSSVGTARITGGEALGVVLELFSDQGDDNADKWDILVNADDILRFRNNATTLIGITTAGNLGIGATTVNSNLSVVGNAHIGSLYQGISAPTDGLFVDGNVGIGATTSSNKLDVWGNTRIAGNLTLDGTLTTNGTITPSGQFLAIDGSKSAPSYSFASSGNGDNGMYLPSANALSFSTAGNDVLTLTAGGNVGIGITSPGSALTVIGNVGIGTSAAGAALQVNGGGLFGWGTASSALSSGAIAAFNGNVGIGTTSPAANLEIIPSSNSYLRFSSTSDAPSVQMLGNGDGTNYAWFELGRKDSNQDRWQMSMAADASNRLRFIALPANTENLSLLPGGNVGIGATIPNAKLSIQGNVGIGYTGVNQAIPVNGLAVFGNVGIGTTTANSNLSISGNTHIGSIRQGISAPTDGLFVDGNVGIGATTSSNKLDVWGNARIAGTLTVDSTITPTGQFLAIDGSKSAPSYSFASSGNGDNGMYLPSANALSFSTAGNDVLTLTAGGNVGIGITSPSQKLEINGNALLNATRPELQLLTSGTGKGRVAQYAEGAAYLTANLYYDGTNWNRDNTSLAGSVVDISDVIPFRLRYVASGANPATLTESMRVNTNGNVGIGLTTANSQLSISNNVHIGSLYQGTVAPTNGLFVDGNVGIGATTSSNKLDVWGNARIAGTLTVDSTSTFGGNLTLSSGQFLAPNGTSSLPSYSFTNSTSTGMYSPSTNALALNTNGAATPPLTITAGGNVGIGTTAPSAILETVLNAGSGRKTNLRLTITSPFANTSATSLGFSRDVSGSGATAADAAFISSPWTGSNLAELVFATGGDSSNNGTEKVRINSSGNVGIGFTSPDRLIQIASDINLVGSNASLLGAAGTQFAITGSSGTGGTEKKLVLGIDTTDNFGVIQAGAVGTNYTLALNPAGGNVGIGTTTANSNLSVSGNAHIGSIRQGISAPTDGLFVDGNVGIGATTSSNKLDVWGNTRLAGTLTVDSTSTFGGDLTLAGNLLPSADDTFDLGSNTARWNNVYVGPSTVHIGTSTSDEYTLAYDTTNNRLGFNVNGSGPAEIVMDSNGNVGIGLTNPAYALDVNRTSALAVINATETGAGQFLAGINAATDDSTMSFFAYDDGYTAIAAYTGKAGIQASGGNFFVSAFDTGADIEMYAGGRTFGQLRMFIEGTSGNVGIGTTSSGANLSVSGNGVFGFGGATSIAGPSNGLGISGNLGVGTTTANSNLTVVGNAMISQTWSGLTVPTSGLLVEGNVGIGATTSSNKLDVWGNARIAGTLTVDSTITPTGQFLAIDGSKSAPSYSFASSGNGDNGMYLPSANALSFSTAGNDVLTLTAGGNVGIGTTSPEYQLTVKEGTAGKQIYLRQSSADNGWLLGTANVDGALHVYRRGEGVSPTDNERLTISAGGSVGIGFTSPAATLDVVGTSLLRGTGGTYGLAVTSNGNVGIGTTSPGAKMELTDNSANPAALFTQVNADNPTLRLVGGSGTSGNGTFLQFYRGTTSIGYMDFASASNQLRLNSSVNGNDIYFSTNAGNILFDPGSANNTRFISGNVGIGTSAAGARLQVNGGGLFGWGTASIAGPSNGLGISGNLGVGTTTANSNLTVVGNAMISQTWSGLTVPTSGLLVEGNVGIGATTSSNKLDVWGNARIAGTLTVDSTITPTGQFLAIDGSKSAPSYSFASSGNGDNGMYLPSANALSFSTAGNDVLTLTAGGNVGIGLTNPTATLQIGGTGTFSTGTGAVSLNGTTTIAANKSLTLASGTGNYAQTFSGTTQTPWMISSTHAPTAGGTQNVTSLTITNNPSTNANTLNAANWSITENSNLVNTINGLKIAFTDSGTGASIKNGLNIDVTTANVNDTTYAAILQGGNVGIGATLPQATLVIQGNVGIGYTGVNQVIPTNGLAVFGNVGIGTTTANSNLSVAGSAHIGGTYQGIAGPTNGLFVDGNVGIGATTSSNKLDVWGNARIAGNLTVDGTLTNSANQFLAANGSASTPAYSFTNLTNAGLWTNGNGLLLTTGGSDTSGITLTGAGLVGIGTTNPTYRLDVKGTANTSAQILRLLDSDNTSMFELKQDASGNSLAYMRDTNEATQITLSTSGSSSFNGGNVGIGAATPGSKLHVTGNAMIGYADGGTPASLANGLAVSGNVGIGTTSPDYQLHIYKSVNDVAGLKIQNPNNGASAQPWLGFYNDGAGTYTLGFASSGQAAPYVNQAYMRSNGANGLLFITADATPIKFFPNSTEAMRIASGGNVGIGFTSPDRLLQIGSDINIVGTAASILGANGAQFSITGSTANTLHKKLTLGLDTTDNYGVLQAGNTDGTAYNLVLNPGGGNVGIGTTTPNSKLSVIGGGVFTNTWGGAVAPTAGLIVEGNTGIGVSAPVQQFQVNPNGSSGFVVTSSGFVGIGVTTPGVRLDILNGTLRLAQNDGDAVNSARLIIDGRGATPVNASIKMYADTATLTPGVLFHNNAGTAIGRIGLDRGTSTVYTGASQDDLVVGTDVSTNKVLLGTNSIVRLTVDTAGNIGIGITTANSTLSIAGSAHIGTIRQGISAPTNGLFVDGNVGIGATTSSNKLDVWGNAAIVGNLTLTGNLLPATDDTFDLGSNTARWNNLYLGPATLHLGTSTSDEYTLAYDTTNNRLGFNVNGSGPAEIVMDSNGNVGIGITNPAAKLEVDQTTGDVALFLSTQAANDNAIRFRTNQGDSSIGLVLDNSNTNKAAGIRMQPTTGSLTFNTGLASGGGLTTATEKMQLDTNGNLGIGTQTPIAQLDVRDTNTGTGLHTYIGSSAGQFGILNNGNVGIGTTTPGEALHVVDNNGRGIKIERTSATASSWSWRIQSGGQVQLVQDSGGANDILIQPTAGKSLIINEDSADADLRIESDINVSAFFLKGSSGNIGIGTSSPLSLLSVAGNAHIGSIRQGISAPTDGLFVDGNVGIGATTSSNKLDVWGNARIAGTLALDGSLTLASGQFLAPDGTASLPSFSFSGDTDTGLWRLGTNFLALTTNGAGALQSGTTINGLSINANGNVGIGTTSPNATLEVAGATSTISNNTGNLTITPNSNLIISQGNVGIGLTTANSQLSISNNVHIGSLFQGTVAPTNGLFVDGNVGIGFTNANQKLEVAGRIRMQTWTADGDTAVYKDDPTGDIGVQASDIRLKKNLEAIENPLDIISRINGYKFNMLDEPDGSKKRLGVIAQDLLPVLPEATFTLTTESGEEYYGVHYEKLTALLIEGVKKQQTQINDLIAQQNANSSLLSGLSVNSDGTLSAPEIKTDKLVLSVDLSQGQTLSTQGLTLTSSADGTYDLDVLASLNSISTAVLGVQTQESTTSAQLANLESRVDSQESRVQSLEEKLASLSAQIATSSAQQSASSSASEATASSLTTNYQLPTTNSLDLTPPDILLATQSAQLVNLEVTSDATISGQLTTYDLNIQNSLKSLGTTTMGNTLIAGDLTVDGTLTLTGSSISTLSTLYIQNGSLAGPVDFFNGLVTIDNNGQLTAQTVTAEEVVTRKLTISNTPIASSSASLQPTIGSGKLLAGQTKIAMLTNQITPTSKVFITPKSSTQGQMPYVELSEPDIGFVVSIDSPVSRDIDFDWWIVDSKE